MERAELVDGACVSKCYFWEGGAQIITSCTAQNASLRKGSGDTA